MIICPHCQALNDDRNTICIRCGGSLIDDPALAGDPFVGRRLGKRFTLHDIIGSGEIGMVYRGIDDKTGQGVAVKIVHPDVAALHGDELLDWARRVAQIRHAKVAAMLGASREGDGTTYIVSELLEGETLRALLERVGPLSARRAVDILFQLCNALAPIHKVGRPHANLKPENVFLIAGQQGDFVKIADTGSPVLFGVHHTPQGKVIIGAAKYFSPEQARGDEVGLASDQFTVGVIGYQLLSGALPFFGATPDQLLDAIVNNRPTPIAERAPATPPALAAIVERCMAKSPADRYPDLRALAAELAGVIKTKAAPAAAPARKPFGGGQDFSTVVARPDHFASPMRPGKGFGAADAEATVMQDIPAEIQALLRDEDDDLPPLDGEATPMPDADADDDLDFAGGIGGGGVGGGRLGGPDDLAAALADAAASIDPPRGGAAVPGAGIRARQTAPRVSPPAPEKRAPAPPEKRAPEKRPAADDPLAAALAEAEAELDAGGAPEVFNPFDDLDLGPRRPAPPAPVKVAPSRSSAPAPPAPPATPAPRISTPGGGIRSSVPAGPLSSDDILSAIGEELSPADAPKVVVPAGAANPLATAADFASLSVPPREVGHVSVRMPAVTGQVVTAGGRAPRSKAPLIALLVLLIAAGGAAVWFFVLAPGESPPQPVRPPAADKKPAPKPPVAAGRAFALVSVPPGAEVVEDGATLGKTPMELRAEGPRTLVLKLAGRPDTPFVLDPQAIAVGADGAAAEVAVTLAEPAAEGAGGAGGSSDAVEAGAAGAAGAAGQGRRRPAGPPIRRREGDRAKPPRRRQPARRRPPSVNDIRDPFANP
ncbi:MAG: protein kinase [Myxococcales bacterium]|nr:protein kinase [Myxococcales bacterium]